MANTPLTGQVAVTGSPQQLDSSDSAASSTVFTIKASAKNANRVFIGPTGVATGTGHCLDPGDDFTYQRNTQNGQPSMQLRVSGFYVVGTAGSDIVTWLASP